MGMKIMLLVAASLPKKDRNNLLRLSETSRHGNLYQHLRCL